MKTSALLLLVFFFSIKSFSQVHQGLIEASVAGTFGSLAATSTATSQYGGGSNSNSTSYITLQLSPGYFVTNGLELQPEIQITAVDKEKPLFNLAAVACYNFELPNSNVVPFILAGYGICNTIPILNAQIMRSSDKMDIGNLNLGAGVKVFVSPKIAVKVEYRYQNYSYKQDFSFYNTALSYDYSLTSHKLMFGFSLFL